MKDVSRIAVYFFIWYHVLLQNFIATSTCQDNFTQPDTGKGDETHNEIKFTRLLGHSWSKRPKRTGRGTGQGGTYLAIRSPLVMAPQKNW